MSMIARVLILSLFAIGQACIASPSSLELDFESASAGSTNAPNGWMTVGASGDCSYSTETNGNPGLCGNFDWTGANQTAPGVYLVNAGSPFDASKSITGTFNFFVVEEGNYSANNFIIGDVQNGLTKTSPGEFINVYLDEIQFGSRAQIYDGAGTILFNGDGNNTYQLNTGQWNYDATFSWTPTNGLTGDFSFSWKMADGTQKGPMTVTGFTFDSQEVFFGFGTGRAAGRVDNISITGETIDPAGTVITIK